MLAEATTMSNKLNTIAEDGLMHTPLGGDKCTFNHFKGKSESHKDPNTYLIYVYTFTIMYFARVFICSL